MISIFKKYSKFIFVLFFLVAFISCVAEASETDGTIDPVSKTALLCTNDGCTTTSQINFKTTNGTPVHITDTEVTGYAWSTDMGWINMNPSQSGVTNTTAGVLGGYAWGQNAGWINFSPSNGGVSINSTGEFVGYAWAQNYGWIKFDCTVSNACVKTDWRPESARGSEEKGSTVIGGSSMIIVPAIPPSIVPPPSSVKTFCELNPNHSSCVNVTPSPTFCESHPSDPSCISAPLSFCELNPSHSSCVTVGPVEKVDDTDVTEPVDQDDQGEGKGKGKNIFAITQVDIENLLKEFNKIEIAVVKTVEELLQIIKTPTGEAVTTIITAIGVISGATIGLATVLFANPLTFSELFLIPLRIWSLILAALGIKKRSRPWGTVYDSITKQPLDPAYVILQDLNGNEVATSITDLDGRYGFLVPAGQYIMIANKTNYDFPSKKLLGKSEDELYHDLYFSGIIEVVEGGVITKNIPMDPLKFDWNEFAKKDQKLMRFFSKRDVFISKLSNFLFIFGFIITSIAVLATPKVYNIVIFCIYSILYILKHTVMKARPYGRLTEGGNPLSFAIIRVFSVSAEHEIIHKVSDKTGKYYCLIPNGNYYIKIEKKNEDGSYTLVYTSSPVEVKKGYINNNFKI